jgi:nucleoid DNA-binding protein
MSVTKRDLVIKVAKEIGLRQKDVAEVVQMLLDEVADEIVKNGNIHLKHLGGFETVIRKSRPGRNPRAPGKGDIVIPERVGIRFRVSKGLKKRVRKLKIENNNILTS